MTNAETAVGGVIPFPKRCDADGCEGGKVWMTLEDWFACTVCHGTGRAANTEQDAPPTQYTVTRYVPPPEYDEGTHRALWEEQARHAMTKHCAQHGVTLLDGAVGKWEPLHSNTEEPERITMWCYRLVGWSG